LLCRHHYQRSRIALGKIEAAAYDADGCRVILPGDTVNQVGERTAPAVASQLP
jgi:hypothetical protein